MAASFEKLVRIPLGTKLYIRLNWKDVRRRPGKLELCEHWKVTFDLARRYQKGRVARDDAQSGYS